MKYCLAALLLTLTLCSQANRITVTVNAGNQIYYPHGGSDIAAVFNPQPGDTLVVATNVISFNMSGIVGSAGHPIVIVPADSAYIGAYAAYVGNITWSRYFKLVGFHINGAKSPSSAGTPSNFGFYIGEQTDHYEASNLQIINCGIGLMAKQNPSTDGSWPNYPAYTQDSVWIHNCTVRNTQTEGYYIGYTYDVTSPLTSPLDHLRLDHLVADSTGWDGVQVNGLHTSMHDITVTRYGTRGDGGQQCGIIFGGQGTYIDSIYNISITTGTGAALMFFNRGSVKVTDAQISNPASTSGQAAIYASDFADLGYGTTNLQLTLSRINITGNVSYDFRNTNNNGTTIPGNVRELRYTGTVQGTTYSTALMARTSTGIDDGAVLDTFNAAYPSNPQTKFYVSTSGTGSGDGTIGNPFTITQSNAHTYNTSDSVLLKRGDAFNSTLSTSTSYVHYGYYGTGAKPKFSSLVSVTGWVSQGGGVWKANCSSCGSTLNMVTVNGANVAMGRTPNTGWFTSSASTSTSITSSSLNSATTNWTGADVWTKDARYNFNKRPITSHSGSTINFGTVTSGENPITGWGFFIQNDLRTLDTLNEWFYNTSTKDIYFYSGGSAPTNIKAATIDRYINLQSVTGITFDSLAFEGSNDNAVEFGLSNRFKFNQCDFTLIGGSAIIGGNAASYDSVTNCTFTNVQGNAVKGVYGVSHFFISRDTAKNIGLIPGGAAGSNQSGGFSLNGEKNNFTYNYLDSIGHHGIDFNGDSCNILYNFVNHVCMSKNDGGGIYTWAGGSYPTNFGINIIGNTVINGYGNPGGEGSSTTSYCSGIYLDLNGNGILVKGNTVANNLYAGIFLTQGKYVIMRGNTVYNNGVQLSFLHDSNSPQGFNNNRVVSNIFMSKGSGQPLHEVLNGYGDYSTMATYDSNYYSRPLTEASVFVVDGVGLYNLSQWQSTYTGRDVHSAITPTGTLAASDNTKIKFDYNSTGASSTVPLSFSYVDLTNTAYNTSYSLPAYSSKVLLQTSSNILPVANAGSNQTIQLPTNSVTLNGTGSTDADGTITGYSWAKTGGPTGGVIGAPTTASTLATGLNAGVYTFQLTVTDNAGGTNSATVSITVNPANVAPTVNAGTNKTIQLPTNTSSVTGTASDADGTISSTAWAQVGTTPAVVVIATPAALTTGVSGLTVAGTYTLRLTATDNQSATSTSTMTITVLPANVAPVAGAGSNATITLPTNAYQLVGSGSDADGTVVSYAWTQVSGPTYTINNAAIASPFLSNLVAGTYVFRNTVTDNQGATGTATMTLTVNAAANIPPTVTVNSSATSVTLPTNTVTLSSTATDPDGTIASYSWAMVSGPATVTFANPASASTTATNLLSAGTYVLRLTVTDNLGASASSSVSISVNVVGQSTWKVNGKVKMVTVQ